jgi:glycosyltransferase involved in cell wall biosynthesis
VLRVAAYTSGRLVPASRFRVEQYRGTLLRRGIDLRLFPAAFGSFPPRARAYRPGWLVGTLLQRIPGVVRSHSYDVTLLQREMVATLVTLEPFTGRPRVLDVDDAIWLYSRAGAAGRIAGTCDAVFCGNSFLADYFGQYCSNVFVIPTAVDIDRFRPSDAADTSRAAPVLGWSGQRSALPDLYRIEEPLATVLELRPDCKLRVICDRPPHFRLIAPKRVDFVRWHPDVEVAALQSLTVGLMPLADTEWARGKCSYKMLLYMACGVPAVVSPVGMNAEVLAHGEVGVGARTAAEWIDALLHLVDDARDHDRMANAGRRVAVDHFSLNAVGALLAQGLHAVAA